MTIGKVAEQTGLSTQAVRFYERERLLPKPERTHTGYRIYRAEDLATLHFISTARHLGFSLLEIKEILKLSRAGRAPCCRVRELLGQKAKALDRRIAELRRFREQLRNLLRQLDRVPDQTDTSRHICALIETAPRLISLGGLPKNQSKQSGTKNSQTSLGSKGGNSNAMETRRRVPLSRAGLRL